MSRPTPDTRSAADSAAIIAIARERFDLDTWHAQTMAAINSAAEHIVTEAEYHVDNLSKSAIQFEGFKSILAADRAVKEAQAEIAATPAGPADESWRDRGIRLAQRATAFETEQKRRAANPFLRNERRRIARKTCNRRVAPRYNGEAC